MTFMLKPIGEWNPESAPPSRTDWATEQIRRAVVFGEVAPGERLTSSSWGARLGVSQTPLREAFQRLAAEGLLTYNAQRGARVAPVSLQELAELYDLRVDLEPRAVLDSVGHADVVWKRDVEAAYAALRETGRPDGADAYRQIEAHSVFHRTIRSRCSSTWLLRITDMLADHAIRFAFFSVTSRGGRRATTQEHQAIYTAAMAGDAKLCAQLVNDHLQITRQAAQSALRDSRAGHTLKR